MIVNSGKFADIWKDAELETDGIDDGVIMFIGKQSVFPHCPSIPEIIGFATEHVSELGFDVDPADVVKLTIDDDNDTFEVVFRKGAGEDKADREMLPF